MDSQQEQQEQQQPKRQSKRAKYAPANHLLGPQPSVREVHPSFCHGVAQGKSGALKRRKEARPRPKKRVTILPRGAPLPGSAGNGAISAIDLRDLVQMEHLRSFVGGLPERVQVISADCLARTLRETRTGEALMLEPWIYRRWERYRVVVLGQDYEELLQQLELAYQNDTAPTRFNMTTVRTVLDDLQRLRERSEEDRCACPELEAEASLLEKNLLSLSLSQ